MIVKSARSMGHRVSIIRESELQLRFGNSHGVHWKGKPLPKFDAIIVRPGFKGSPSIHAATIRQIELEGQLVINGYLGVQRAKNKVRTLQLLDHFELPIPRTVIVRGVSEVDAAIEGFKFPIIIKAAYGSGGNGIFIAESKRSLVPIVEFLLTRGIGDDPVKIQEYIEESEGKDIRIFVVGKKVIAAMERSAKPGDFRSNFHQGGSVASAELTKEEKRISIEATQRMGLNFSGVDILRTNSGPVIIEVNSHPGLEGITLATGIDIAGKIVEYVVRKAKKRKKKMKGVRETAGRKEEG